ncbi:MULTISPECIES: hypothetical protein [unclassified Streptomyces]|uniref:hypothetical protein n=1 Tax=unclassified Streptomyces TaxID=2593676 RepID=UPI0022B74B1B|nr:MULTISPECIES: hypothetical protein [unclassified Streptomyces]MCZ7415367.1 hypothetical protein [Streptomyces sp. WMMC897]MCZ7432289.1 hypothetical protein [Streptomyces sp. WMMC1477]
MATTPEPTPTPTQEEFLLESFLALETPEGFKAELIEGNIVVTPPPLLSEPVEDDYTRTTSASFGKPLPLPDPFGFELDTSDLL